MIRKATKIKDNVFSSSQLAVSVVPIRELDHTKANTAINANKQITKIAELMFFKSYDQEGYKNKSQCVFE